MSDDIELNSGSDYIDSVLGTVKDTLKLSDGDIDILRRANKLLLEPTPTVQVMIEARVDSIDRLCVELRNLLYILENKIGNLDYEYKTIYDEQFTNLVRKGRPSQQAIESEIHSSNEFMMQRRQLLTNFEYLKNLITGYLRSLKDCKETCIRKWGNV